MDLLVLCYHAISPGWEAPLSVTPAAFERQLELLIDRGYRGATFSEAVAARPGRRTVAVTFDDAYRSVIELGLPILSRLGLPATVFVPTAFAGTERPMSWPGIDHWVGGRHERELVPMSWSELNELRLAGWEVGSHTRTHPRLTQLDDGALDRELRGSRDECEQQLGSRCRSLAYPYGDHDARVVSAAHRAGYVAAGTLPARLHAASALRWPRVGVYNADRSHLRFSLKVSPAMRRLRTSRAWELLDALPSTRDAVRWRRR